MTYSENNIISRFSPLPNVYIQLYDAFVFAFTTLLSLLMLMLIADRFLSTKYPFRYKIRFRQVNLKRYIVGMYVLAIILGVAYFTLPKLKNVLLYVLVIMALPFLVLSIATYTMIIKKVQSSRQAFKNTSHIQLSRMKFKKMYLIPLFIIVTYLLFYFIPWLVFSIHLVHRNRDFHTFLVGETFEVITGIVLLVDPLIYIWLTSKYRKVILSTCCCGFGVTGTSAVENGKCSVRSTTTFVMENRKVMYGAHPVVYEPSPTSHGGMRGHAPP